MRHGNVPHYYNTVSAHLTTQLLGENIAGLGIGKHNTSRPNYMGLNYIKNYFFGMPIDQYGAQ